ncbi:hypothetical protein OROGR_011516 [Orobanche gracilis]
MPKCTYTPPHIQPNTEEMRGMDGRELMKNMLKKDDNEIKKIRSNKKRALLIAIAEELKKIPCEVERLQEVLTKNLVFYKSNIKVLVDYDGHTKPNKNTIQQEVQIMAKSGKISLLLVMGHGGKYDSLDIFPTHSPYVKGVVIIVYMDCCYAGALFKRAKQFSRRRGKIIFYGACEEGQKAIDGDFLSMSVLPILRSMDKKITNEEFYNMIYKKFNDMKTKAKSVLYCTNEMRYAYHLED